jgi:hypothetical protein
MKIVDPLEQKGGQAGEGGGSGEGHVGEGDVGHLASFKLGFGAEVPDSVGVRGRAQAPALRLDCAHGFGISYRYYYC